MARVFLCRCSGNFLNLPDVGTPVKLLKRLRRPIVAEGL